MFTTEVPSSSLVSQEFYWSVLSLLFDVQHPILAALFEKHSETGGHCLM